jgi:1-aminocyclopropane-1-carboxylate deaminase/D-cysteine desulfhydrase-like pyridoxal-dependent ACC family enzyme
MNTAEELKFIKDIAAATGIVLDPVYRCNTFLLCVASYLISCILVLPFK